MPSHEEGEFELVLGNKQLLSMFFLVILLLGVFFSMGYIVGRNTTPATTLSATNRTPPIMVDANGGTAIPRPDPTKPSALDNPPRVTRPSVDPSPTSAPIKTEPVKVEPVIQPPPIRPVPVTKVEPNPEPPVKTAPATQKGSTFLQVVATRRADAEKVVATLSQKGFAASMSPVPDSALVRVIVGPLADNAAVAKNREGLQAAGYQPIVRKF